MKLISAISLNMTPNETGLFWFWRKTPGQAATIIARAVDAEILSNFIGHPNTDLLVRTMLFREAEQLNIDLFDLPVGRRETVTFNHNDEAIVAQYHGPRLTEGTTELPEGAMIQFYFVIYASTKTSE